MTGLHCQVNWNPAFRTERPRSLPCQCQPRNWPRVSERSGTGLLRVSDSTFVRIILNEVGRRDFSSLDRARGRLTPAVTGSTSSRHSSCAVNAASLGAGGQSPRSDARGTIVCRYNWHSAGARFTKYLTIYRKIILSLSQDRLTIVT